MQSHALCQLDDLPETGGLEVCTQTPDGPRWIAVFAAAGGAVAYLNSCPHQGRSLAFAPDEFLFGQDGRLICPHHGACFDIATGLCVAGPCEGASLAPVNILIRDGVVYLAKKSG